MMDVHKKHGSIKVMQELLGNRGCTRMNMNNGARKDSMPPVWHSYKTVSWRKDAQRDFDEHTSKIFEKESWISNAYLEGTTWAIPGLVGFLTATSGCFIEKTVEWLASLRFGYCTTGWFYVSDEQCGKENWVTWSFGYPAFIAVSTLLATVSAILTWSFAPMARGSGIPEIKTILGGFVMPEVLESNTLVIKIVGLSLSVAAGLSCGKEGPLVHIACCWSHLISKFVARYADNEAKQRELLSCACAAGVAIAFGAPLGGVLFSLEEASTMFPTRTMIRAFFASSAAAVSLSWYNPMGTGRLTMFEAHYNNPPGLIEYAGFLLLGILGGCIGALFVHYNVMVSQARSPGTPFRRRCHIILEVLVIAAVTAATSYPLLYTRVLSNVTIRALFHPCTDTKVDPQSFMLDLCNGTRPEMTMEIVSALALSGLLRFVQMIFTFGTGVPAGLFIPCLYTGACLGRIMGIGVHRLNGVFEFEHEDIWVGIYAMLGAAAVLGGACRVTISLVVIMFELTGGLQLIVPFMVTCLTAKFVGDLFTLGIYDYCIVIRKYPHLHEPDESTYSTSAKDIMEEVIDCIHPEPGTLGSLLKFLREAKHGGYPLTKSETDPTLLGYIHTAQLTKHLETTMEENLFVSKDTAVAFSKFLDSAPRHAVNLSGFVDECVVIAVPETPAAQLHSMFRNLGIKLVLIVRRGALVGMITKKSFIRHMDSLHHEGHKQKKPGRWPTAICNTQSEPAVYLPETTPRLLGEVAGERPVSAPGGLHQPFLGV